ncbi:MAG: hypothetical protein A2096_00045 [Spirochaetes bacterium GWF1_41_5]|nr:MAG: hypothetical protein A2096_00045 [Spirochaetes bacterium GWF1_41_5]
MKNSNACLVIINGPDENRKILLFSHTESGFIIESEGKDYTIGSHKNDDILVKDKKVSKNHALLQRKDDRCIITCKSGRDLQINGKPAKEPILLASGDQILLGETEIKFLQGDIKNLYYENIRNNINIEKNSGAWQKHYFATILEKQFYLAKRHNDDLSVIFISLKKNENSSGYHEIIREAGKSILHRIRKTDTFGSLSDGVYCILCPETGSENAGKFMKKFVNSIENEIKTVLQAEIFIHSASVSVSAEIKTDDDLISRGLELLEHS